MTALTLKVLIERKQAEMPAFVLIPAAAVAGWKLAATTTIEGTLDGIPLGRRSIHRWDDRSWFIELRKGLLDACGKSPGDHAVLEMSLASTALPGELRKLIDGDPQARKNWEARTAAQQRMIREDILAAKAPATREGRARRALLPLAKPTRPPIEGLPSTMQPMDVRIVGSRLPGRACGPYTDVKVGFVQKAGCCPDHMVPADASEASWSTRIEVCARNGVPAFRGPSVNGPPSERFFYLSWVGRKDGGAAAMFRRAKLRLDAVPPEVLVQAVRSGRLVGRLDLTANDGMPVCASVRPPAIRWATS